MRPRFIVLLLLGMAIADMSSPARAIAQGPDTLDVLPVIAEFPALVTTILGDTAVDGSPLNPNRVYRLARGAVYFCTGTMELRRDVVIIANDEPASIKPPVIAPMIFQGDITAPAPVFKLHKNALLRNLYLTRIRPDTSSPQSDNSQAIQIMGDSTRIIVQRCVFDGWGSGAIFKGAVFNKIYITDCKFRNMMNGDSWFGGWAFESGATPGDTLIMMNNTMFNCGAYFCAPNRNITTFIRIEHNTVFTTHTNPLYGPYMTNARIRDNIFWGTLARGQSQSDFDEHWTDWGGPFSTISIDTLPPAFGFPEANRMVIVTNNVYFWPQAYFDEWQNVYQDTLIPPVWMDDRTLGMFADKITWPNLGTPADDLYVDPGFDSAMVNTVVTNLLAYCRHSRGDSAAQNQHYYLPTGQDLFNVPWPVPENLAYSNTALQSAGHDGFPVGDLNWFHIVGGEWVDPTLDAGIPEKFQLLQNYPNPFNPTTVISYQLPVVSEVKLVVYDMLGREIAVLVNERKVPGRYEAKFDASGLASGIYFYRLQARQTDGGQAGNFVQTRKLVLLK
jgi:hypothetical protein